MIALLVIFLLIAGFFISRYFKRRGERHLNYSEYSKRFKKLP